MIILKAGRYYTVEEVARLRNCVVQTVRNQILKGNLQAVQLDLTRNKMVYLIHEKAFSRKS